MLTLSLSVLQTSTEDMQQDAMDEKHQAPVTSGVRSQFFFLIYFWSHIDHLRYVSFSLCLWGEVFMFSSVLTFFSYSCCLAFIATAPAGTLTRTAGTARHSGTRHASGEQVLSFEVLRLVYPALRRAMQMRLGLRIVPQV